MAEAGRRVQVDVASEETAELALQINELKEANPGIGGELDEHVDVALGAEVLTQDGAEEGQATNAAAPTEGGQSLCVDIDLQAHAAPPLRSESCDFWATALYVSSGLVPATAPLHEPSSDRGRFSRDHRPRDGSATLPFQGERCNSDSGGGPRRTRTFDRPIMSRLL